MGTIDNTLSDKFHLLIEKPYLAIIASNTYSLQKYFERNQPMLPVFWFSNCCPDFTFISILSVLRCILLFTTHTAGEMDPVFATLRAASGLRRPNRGYSETETGSDLALEFGPDEFGPGDNSASFNMSPPVYSSRDFPR